MIIADATIAFNVVSHEDLQNLHVVPTSLLSCCQSKLVWSSLSYLQCTTCLGLAMAENYWLFELDDDEAGLIALGKVILLAALCEQF